MSQSNQPYEKYVTKPEKLIDFLVEKDREIANLQRILYNLHKSQFGSKSEKLSLSADNQLPLLHTEEIKTPEVEKVAVPAHSRKTRVRRYLSKLPTNEIEIKPGSTLCPCCGEQMCEIGRDDISTELEYQPAKLMVNKYVRPRYACGSCKKGVVQASLPDTVKPLNRRIASASLLAYTTVAKYQDHIPLNRQEQSLPALALRSPERASVIG